MKRFMIVLLSAALLAAAGYSVFRVLTYNGEIERAAGHPHYLNGRQITAMKVYDLKGSEKPISELLTGDINVINFWASWCEPCNREMPELVNYYKMKLNHIQLIGINIQDKQAARDAFVNKYHANYPMLTADDSVRKTYKINNLPTTIFVDKQGKVLKTYLGEVNQQTLTALIQQIEEGK